MDEKKAKVLKEAQRLGIEVDPSLHEYVIEAMIAKKLRGEA
jgi:hypothetical protein